MKFYKESESGVKSGLSTVEHEKSDFTVKVENKATFFLLRIQVENQILNLSHIYIFKKIFFFRKL